MKKKIEDYLITFPNFLDKDFCKEAIKDLENDPDLWEKHSFYNYKEDVQMSRSGDNELDVLYSQDYRTALLFSRNIIMEKIHTAIQEYINICDCKWFAEWAGYTSIRYNRYSLHQTMALHCDHIHDMFDGEAKGIPTLSLLGLLNDDFEGGELIFFEDKKIDTKQGDLLIFPSNFLYPHGVEPVTKGTRYTYVSWVW